MKTYYSTLIILVFYLIAVKASYGQINFVGVWEGIFMKDFKVIIEFNAVDQNQAEGNIKMMAGNNIIQNDSITDIERNNQEFKFFIPDKQTPFTGNFNNRTSELSGVFIFPDSSKHAILLKKRIKKPKTIEVYKNFKEKNIPSKDLETDLMFLYSSLKKYHPQLYAFTSQDAIDNILELLKSEIYKAQTIETFFKLTTKLTDAIRCSHTGVRLPINYQNIVDKFGRYFPLRLYFANNKAFFISGNLLGSDNTLLPGNEIISINNKSIDSIITQLFYFIPTEGCNVTTKYNQLNKNFNSLYNLLDDSEEFIVKYKTSESIVKTTVKSCIKKELETGYFLQENKNLVDFNYMNNNSIGVLKIASFSINDMDQYLKKLDSIFNNLITTNTKSLIVDLRDNSGGHPIFAAQLLSYLTNKDFIYFKKNEEVKDFEPLYNIMHPNKLNFSEDLYIFVNGGCLSTTGHLISLLKYHTNAIFIGEEPGSTFRCNDLSLQITLPNTGIELNVPRTTFETNVTGFTPCEPFLIDHKVNSTLTEIINNEDSYYKLVQSILNK